MAAANLMMNWSERIFGRPLRTDEQSNETLGIWAGIAVLGLDAIASASYGPEAALTALIPLGGRASAEIIPISLAIGGVLIAVYFSYRQIISAYPNGGGSYVVAKENLGARFGLLAAAALSIDYILNVAVAISAGVGALVSVVPALLPHTLALCLFILVLLTLLNLRGLRTTGLLFLTPTYLFIAMLGGALVLALIGGGNGGGGLSPVTAAPAPQAAGPDVLPAISLWLWLRAFSSGCSALTGVEAVSNAVPVFRSPNVRKAKATLSLIVAFLLVLLCGIAVATARFHLRAAPPGQEGFQSLISQITSGAYGRGGLYYISLAATIAVLSLSANTSFTAFPRLCRLLALDGYLPQEFCRRGSRLVYTWGIFFLSVISGLLLIAFSGITDRLIPLFAVGAFLAFSAAQVGMVRYWQRHPKRARVNIGINATGAIATLGTAAILIVLKFREGAWITLIAIPVLIALFTSINRYLRRLDHETRASGPLDLRELSEPIVLLPIKRLDLVARKALRLALCFASEIHVVHIRGDDEKEENLAAMWRECIEAPVAKLGRPAPRLVTISSDYREFFEPLIEYTKRVVAEHPHRPTAVWVPELTERRWYTFILRHRANRLKRLLIMSGMPQILIVNTPWYVKTKEEGRSKNAE
ncbi:MAG TPA: APC family permease [Opitutaceae bacterium]|nr:APC family permease [Opitutaceae bacterium]